MEHVEIPRDRIMQRAERIMLHQRQRDARFTAVLTWTSLGAAVTTALIGVLLVAGVATPDALLVAPAVLNCVQGIVAGWLRARR